MYNSIHYLGWSCNGLGPFSHKDEKATWVREQEPQLDLGIAMVH